MVFNRMQITNGDDNVASWDTEATAFNVPVVSFRWNITSSVNGTGSSGQVLKRIKWNLGDADQLLVVIQRIQTSYL